MSAIPALKRRYPLIGNAHEIAGPTPVQNFMKLIEREGPIFEMDIAGKLHTIVSSQAIVNELSNEELFEKAKSRAIEKLVQMGGDGLFTTLTDDPAWQKAHNILMPGFSMHAMRGYVSKMYDIVSQLLLKWERFDESIDVADDMTRITFDTIGICGFGFRFNSFYRQQMHPFVDSMMGALSGSMHQINRPDFINQLLIGRRKRFKRDLARLFETVDSLIEDRKAENKYDKNDLLDLMLTGVDSKTGEPMDPVNIRYQILTFLVAGHETTSGLLSFALYYLLKNPVVLKKARQEVDAVLGGELKEPSFEQVKKLTYINQILKETLRIWPTAPAYAVKAKRDTVLCSKYEVKKGDTFFIILPPLHRDKNVWTNPDEFNPDRFVPEVEQQRNSEFPNCYKPFGNGIRACIGRQFALTEATLVLALVLQKFELSDPHDYQLKIKETLTLKPENFKISVSRRAAAPYPTDNSSGVEQANISATQNIPATHKTPMLILYGSNLGTAENLAYKVGSEALRRGFTVATAKMDDYVRELPVTGVVVFVASTYNGKPTDDALEFCHWLEQGDPADHALNRVKFAVFGCGNTDWETFQSVPQFIDHQLTRWGARNIAALGQGDGNRDLFGEFDSWLDDLWPALYAQFSIEQSDAEGGQGGLYKIVPAEDEMTHPLAASFGAQLIEVLQNRELQQPGVDDRENRSTRQLELALPEQMTYRAGDYLGVIPENGTNLVDRVIGHFQINGSDLIKIKSPYGAKSLLPLNTPLSYEVLFAKYVELQEVVTKKQIKELLRFTRCPYTQGKLSEWIRTDTQKNDPYRDDILDKKKSLLDLLAELPAVQLPLDKFLEHLRPMRPRYYSISSSPSVHPEQCSITVGRLQDTALSGSGVFRGTCSTYLSAVAAGDRIWAFVQPNKTDFALPQDPGVPLILIGPGTGFAPFRGFLMERMMLKKQGVRLGPALSFFGCRHPQQDFIFKEDFERWEKNNISRFAVAFSRMKGTEKGYVQHEMWALRDEVWDLVEKGAIIYVCGNASHMAPEIKKTLMRIYTEKRSASTIAAEEWLNTLSAEKRYRADIWTSN